MFLVKRISDNETFPDFQPKADGDTLLKNAIRGGWADPSDLQVIEVRADLWDAEYEAWLTKAKADAAIIEEAERTRILALRDGIAAKLETVGLSADEIAYLLGGEAGTLDAGAR
jgi:hypothetical protein